MSTDLATKKQTFEHQPDATIDQDNPVSGQKYEWEDAEGKPLGTQKNVRTIQILVNVTWTAQPSPLEIHITEDGQTRKAVIPDPVSEEVYEVCMGHSLTGDHYRFISPASVQRPVLTEARTIKIEAEITGGTVSNLSARVKYAKR